MNEDGRMKKQHVKLSDKDQEYLKEVVRKGELSAKVYRRAFGLLELDQGKPYTAVSKTLQVTIPTLSGWAAKYQENGLEVLLDKP